MGLLKLLKICCFVFISAGLFSANEVNAKGMRVPGTKITIQPPSEFTASEQFPGFQHMNSGSSIMITEIPGPVTEVSRGMTKDGLASRGMILLEKSNVMVNKQDAKLLKIRQYHSNVEYLKWMILFGDSSSSILVVGTYPASVDFGIGKNIKNSILTAVWNKEVTVDFFDGLPFKIGESNELKYAKRMSNMVILGREGEFGKPGMAEPVLIAGNAISQAPINDLAIFSKRRILHATKIEEIEVFEENNIKVDGLDAYELIANAKDSIDKMPMVIYQVIVPERSSYFIVQGLVGESISKSYLTQFRELVRSITIDRN